MDILRRISSRKRTTKPAPDPNIIKALCLDPTTISITSHGHSQFTTTLKLTAKVNGEDKLFFVKTGGKDSQTMFAGEHISLNAIHSVVPSFCPKSHAYGLLASTEGFFLATDFLDMSSRKSTVKGTGVSFAAKLAKLHTTPAPIPEGFSEPQFGFPVPNCIGSTCQLNEYTNSWSEFYAENRLKEILKADIEKNGKDSMLTELVERTASTVVPRLLQSGHLGGQKGITPAIVHGDLWYGNHGQGSIDKGGIEEVVFDCCACYAHSEYDLGCMKMFGGFSEATMGEYHNLKPKDEPVEEYDDRVELYELYHHLNHHTMFGRSYRAGAVAIMRKRIKKYGQEADERRSDGDDE